MSADDYEADAAWAMTEIGALRSRVAALEKERLQRQADLYEIHKVLMWAGEWELNLPPPSRAVVALIEEHHKALVRARNEGREAAAAFADEYQRLIKGLDAFGPKAELAVAAVAAGIRRRKEPESD